MQVVAVVQAHQVLVVQVPAVLVEAAQVQSETLRLQDMVEELMALAD
jgi:hypothetical protein